MKYRIVRIELKDDEVVIYFKKLRSQATIVPKIDSPEKMLEFSMQMGMNLARKVEEAFSFDGFITLEYDTYCTLDLKVGDIVEVEIKPA
jgi:hypothetical protein